MPRIFRSTLLLAAALAADPLKLTLEEAIDTALKNNAALRISHTARAIAEAQYRQALSGRYPRLDLTLSATRMDEPINNEAQGAFTLDKETSDLLYLTGAHNKDLLGEPSPVPGTSWFDLTRQQLEAGRLPALSLPYTSNVEILGRDTFTAQLDLTYPLYTGGKVSALIQQASLNRSVTKEGDRRERARVIYDTRRYYYAVMLARQIRREIGETLERLKMVRDLTEAFYKGDSLKVKKTDYLRTLVTVDLVTSLHEEATASLRSAKAALVNAIGLPWQTRIEVTRQRFPLPESTPRLQRLVEEAYRFNPDYTALKLAVRIGDARIREQESAYLPTLGLQAQARHFDNSYDGGFNTAQNRNSWTIGVGLQWNLFNGFADRHRVEEARLQKRQVETKEVLLKEGLALRIKAAFLQMDRAYRQARALHQGVEHAAENAALNIEAYRAGMVSTKDVIEAQLTEAFTKTAYYKALADYATQRALIDCIITRAAREE